MKQKEVAAVERASRVDWRGAQDRRLLRAGLRLFRDELERHIDAEWGILARLEKIPFSVRGSTDRLIDFLLEMDALDLIGLAYLEREKQAGKLLAGRRKRGRQFLKHKAPHPDPPTETPAADKPAEPT